jgi:hypothetical protein
MTQRSSDDGEAPQGSAKSRYWRGVMWGTLSGWVLVFVPYALVLVVKHYDPKVDTNWAGWTYLTL